MENYTKEQLLKAIKYACGYQKAVSYQEIAHILLEPDNENKVATQNEIKALDNLCDVDSNAHAEITIEDIDLIVKRK